MIRAVNLIPAARRLRRRRLARIHAWSAGIGIAGLIAAAAGLGLRAAAARVGAGDAQTFEQVEAGIERVKRMIGERQALLTSARSALLASDLIDAQPDWGLLMLLVGRRLGEDAAVTRVHLEPAPPKKGQAPAATFTIEGVGLTHECVSRLAIDLEEAGVFSAVRLVQTRRILHAGADAVAFHIECALSGLPGDAP